MSVDSFSLHRHFGPFGGPKLAKIHRIDLLLDNLEFSGDGIVSKRI
jgi:hypothetical protein